MPVAKEEIDRFHRFVDETADNGGADLSLEELLRLCGAEQRERDQANEGIRRGLQELEAGLGRPLDEFAAEFRKRNSIPSET